MQGFLPKNMMNIYEYSADTMCAKRKARREAFYFRPEKKEYFNIILRALFEKMLFTLGYSADTMCEKRTARKIYILQASKERRFNMIQGALLKKMRHIYGYSADTMCEKLNISRSYLSAIENNEKTKKQPSIELLNRYAKVFGIRLSSLMMLSEEFQESKAENFIRELMIKLINRMENETMRQIQEPRR